MNINMSQKCREVINNPNMYLFKETYVHFPIFSFDKLVLSDSLLQLIYDVYFVIVIHLLSCVLLFCDPMDDSMPGFPVLHYLLEIAQTHVH